VTGKMLGAKRLYSELIEAKEKLERAIKMMEALIR